MERQLVLWKVPLKSLFLGKVNVSLSPVMFGINTEEAFLNPSSPHSNENEISLYITNTCSDIQVMRIKKVITKDNMSLDKLPLLVPQQMYGEQ